MVDSKLHACEYCDGEGVVVILNAYNDSLREEVCPHCGGTGLVVTPSKPAPYIDVGTDKKE